MQRGGSTCYIQKSRQARYQTLYKGVHPDDELTQALEAISKTGLVAHAPINQHYVKLRCHDEIVQTIVKTIHRDTITEFIEEYQKSNIRPWGDIPIKNVCYLFLIGW